jgi:PAS domain S-box-containing protein
MIPGTIEPATPTDKSPDGKERGPAQILEIIPEPVVVVNRQGRVCLANAAARSLLACGGALSERPLGFTPPVEGVEVCFREAGGKPRVWQIRVTETEWEGERAWVVTLRDISEQKRIEEGIDAFLAHTPALIYVRDRGGRYTLANQRFSRSAGRGVDQVRGLSDGELFPVDLARHFGESHARVIESGTGVSFECVTHEAGGEHAYLCHEFPLRDDAGRVYAVGGIRTDITDRKRTEESLRQSQVRQRAILESSLDCVVVMDATGCILDFNTAAERTFGYSQREILGRPMADLLLAPAVRDAFDASLKRCLEGSLDRLFDRRVEVTARRKGGAEFAIEMAVSVARYGGSPVVTAVLHDITERMQAHQKLVQQTQHLEHAVGALERVRERERQVLASIPSIFVGLDNQGSVTHWNPAAEKQFGLPPEQVIGKPLRELAIAWPAGRIEDAIARCNRLNEAVRLDELRVQDSTGRERILALTINRTETRGDEDGGVVVVGTNITERKAMEAQLMLAQKMESIGQLAAGIAHEINTPTQYVSDNTRFLRDAFKDLQRVLDDYEKLRAEARQGPVPAVTLDQLDGLLQEADLPFLTTEIPKAIEQSLEGLSRVAEIVRAMKQFSHPDQDEPELTDLNKAIENTVTVARNEWKYVAEVDLDLDPDLPAVPCLAGRFNQVILNLIVNAAQAIAEFLGEGAQTKGSIRITTRRVNDHVEVRVSDTGTGIPARIRNRIFDPFFTTKQVGKGTGQGLAIAHNIIVEQHGGAIGFESEEGKGTTFILSLPLAAPETPAEGES